MIWWCHRMNWFWIKFNWVESNLFQFSCCIHSVVASIQLLHPFSCCINSVLPLIQSLHQLSCCIYSVVAAIEYNWFDFMMWLIQLLRLNWLNSWIILHLSIIICWPNPIMSMCFRYYLLQLLSSWVSSLSPSFLHLLSWSKM